MDLSISNVVSISVNTVQAGAGQYNTSNIALFTTEAYGGGFGSDGYKIYLEPTEVATDFGSDSDTYKQALQIFSQQPNILANRGYLVIIPATVEVQTIIYSGTPVSGVYKLNFGGDVTADIAYDAVAADIQTAIRTLTGLEKAVVTGAAGSFTVTFNGYFSSGALLTVSDNTMVDGGASAVNPVVAEGTDGETFAEAITRTVGLVQYFGIISSNIHTQADMLAAAAVVQALNKIIGFVSRTAADVDPDGMLDLLRQNTYWRSRGLYYGADNDTDALKFLASYFGRGMSVNFQGSNTTLSMHLKQLSGVSKDPTITQTILTKCQTAGVDAYPSIAGNARVFCSGSNDFFDNVYNLSWFIGDLEVQTFNVLAQTGTKIAQTEGGVTSLKSAQRRVCEQARINQYLAPGTWTSPTTFGNQNDFYDNISQFGYYIYSAPISQQSPSDRESRVAPLIQIAAKYAGAIHSSTVIINVNP